MNLAILSAEVQAYIQSERKSDPAKLALAKSPFASVSSAEIARQVDGLQRAYRKVPSWVDKASLYYPDKLNLEQSSSSETAHFKASLLEEGKTLIDLTGGFGIDSYYFAQRCKHVTHCELNEELSTIVRHNFHTLGTQNIDFHQGDGVAYLRDQVQSIDYIYIDPSRRVKQQKVFRLEDCEPNMVILQDLFFDKAPIIISKLAPLLDISLALKSLKNVRDVYIISIDNDCKELIFIQDKEYIGTPVIHATLLDKNESSRTFSFTLEEERETVTNFHQPEKYLYEPDVAINKAGAFKIIAKQFNLSKLHPHSHLYTSDTIVEDFLGKTFIINQVEPFSVFKKTKTALKGNVIAKNFPLKVEDIRKKLKIKDGGSLYLFFTTQVDETLIVIYANRLS
ncbi:class I SAM-dependent methyltransferase [Sphingobacterium psychroaquaticum]|uniref:class I SAM-dependent methyltransferase n=1 Tax=Sphingobacterium psychroaquaticum TaxID=561061 RepID=UPI001069D620|nr:class I SAM-dependent methyltransferase [Sphingobacterium psychroaquaticum]QBQ41172.1 class I SAM-dependent methyltransferase [Sphingobacterium psychroaquaticum]